jgi:hypothetical protein
MLLETLESERTDTLNYMSNLVTVRYRREPIML